MFLNFGFVGAVKLALVFWVWARLSSAAFISKLLMSVLLRKDL